MGSTTRFVDTAVRAGKAKMKEPTANPDIVRDAYEKDLEKAIEMSRMDFGEDDEGGAAAAAASPQKREFRDVAEEVKKQKKRKKLEDRYLAQEKEQRLMAAAYVDLDNENSQNASARNEDSSGLFILAVVADLQLYHTVDKLAAAIGISRRILLDKMKDIVTEKESNDDTIPNELQVSIEKVDALGVDYSESTGYGTDLWKMKTIEGQGLLENAFLEVIANLNDRSAIQQNVRQPPLTAFQVWQGTGFRPTDLDNAYSIAQSLGLEEIVIPWPKDYPAEKKEAAYKILQELKEGYPFKMPNESAFMKSFTLTSNIPFYFMIKECVEAIRVALFISSGIEKDAVFEKLDEKLTELGIQFPDLPPREEIVYALKERMYALLSHLFDSIIDQYNLLEAARKMYPRSAKSQLPQELLELANDKRSYLNRFYNLKSTTVGDEINDYDNTDIDNAYDPEVYWRFHEKEDDPYDLERPNPEPKAGYRAVKGFRRYAKSQANFPDKYFNQQFMDDAYVRYQEKLLLDNAGYPTGDDLDDDKLLEDVMDQIFQPAEQLLRENMQNTYDPAKYAEWEKTRDEQLENEERNAFLNEFVEAVAHEQEEVQEEIDIRAVESVPAPAVIGKPFLEAREGWVHAGPWTDDEVRVWAQRFSELPKRPSQDTVQEKIQQLQNFTNEQEKDGNFEFTPPSKTLGKSVSSWTKFPTIEEVKTALDRLRDRFIQRDDDGKPIYRIKPNKEKKVLINQKYIDHVKDVHKTVAKFLRRPPDRPALITNFRHAFVPQFEAEEKKYEVILERNGVCFAKLPKNHWSYSEDPTRITQRAYTTLQKALQRNPHTYVDFEPIDLIWGEMDDDLVNRALRPHGVATAAFGGKTSDYVGILRMRHALTMQLSDVFVRARPSLLRRFFKMIPLIDPIGTKKVLNTTMKDLRKKVLTKLEKLGNAKTVAAMVEIINSDVDGEICGDVNGLRVLTTTENEDADFPENAELVKEEFKDEQLKIYQRVPPREVQNGVVQDFYDALQVRRGSYQLKSRNEVLRVGGNAGDVNFDSTQIGTEKKFEIPNIERKQAVDVAVFVLACFNCFAQVQFPDYNMTKAWSDILENAKVALENYYQLAACDRWYNLENDIAPIQIARRVFCHNEEFEFEEESVSYNETDPKNKTYKADEYKRMTFVALSKRALQLKQDNVLPKWAPEAWYRIFELGPKEKYNDKLNTAAVGYGAI